MEPAFSENSVNMVPIFLSEVSSLMGINEISFERSSFFTSAEFRKVNDLS